MYDRFKWTRQSRARNNLTRAYEPFQPYFLAALAEKAGAGVFLDIGANIGVYSLFLSRCESIRTMHAYEAVPGTFAHLKANIGDNGLAVVPHMEAVSDKPGEVRFGIMGDLSGANGVAEGAIHSSYKDYVTVPAITLDEQLGLSGETIAMKVDVEGHEPQVIAGAKRTIAENRIVLQIEEYGETSSLDSALAGLGLRRIAQVGPDCYHTNIEALAEPQAVVELFERASVLMRDEAMYAYQCEYGRKGGPPLDIGLGGLGQLRLTGAAAAVSRKAYKMLPLRR